MKVSPLNIICLFVTLGIFNNLWAQSLVEDANPSIEIATPGGTFTETIKIISNSKKIFILTNNNQQLTPGDFISLALGNDLAARALVAKTHQGQVGIKILKIYSLSQWAKLRRNQDVLIIKGDDSAFSKKPVTEENDSPAVSKINSEEDLYTNDVTVEDDIDLDENKQRHLKPDNVVSVSGSYLTANLPPLVGDNEKALELGIAWAYQFRDNFFVEGLYGRALFKSFPNNGLSTLVNRVVGRVKFNIKGPAYTFFLPYVGFQSVTVSSPEAGKGDVGPAIAQEELTAVSDLEKSGPVVGVTILRRLVPGWFVKADLGTDVLNLGFAVEF